MADIVTLANSITVSGNPAAEFEQKLEDSPDVSAYKTINLQVTALAINDAGAAGDPSVVISIISSMTNTSDDDSWEEVDSVTITKTSANKLPMWGVLKLPDAAAPLFRFVRWRAVLGTNTSQATFSIQGLAYAL